MGKSELSVENAMYTRGTRTPTAGLALRNLATQPCVDASAMPTCGPYLTQATMGPEGSLRRGIPRHSYPAAWHMATMAVREGRLSSARKLRSGIDIAASRGYQS